VKICIVSDSHDRADALLAAVRDARAAGAKAVFHCGDVIGAQTLKPLMAQGLPVHVVHGNNLGDPIAMAQVTAASDGLFTYHGGDASLTLAGRRIHLTHFPHLARGMACTGDYDLVCCGHLHKPSAVRQKNILGDHTWLVNPGTVAPIGPAPPSWILGDLDAMNFEIRAA
jgi:hypothetical protein